MNDKWARTLGNMRYLAIAVLIIGLIFNFLHWPGAHSFLIIGLTSMACIFALSPFLMGDRGLVGLLLGLGAAANAVGVLFSLLQWPGAVGLLCAGLAMWLGVLQAQRAPLSDGPTVYETFRYDLLLLAGWGAVRLILYFSR